ncbi:MAG TPA: molybdopterin converting factor subunit 1 [Devosia sp.]|nr:molybdopterin converting factor subunit 1 [Devosia sp.]
MKILYFAWLRERLNRNDEEVNPPQQVKTVAQLMDWLSENDEAFEMAFSDRSLIKTALDEEIVEHDTELGNAGTLAFFPPMTGG